jgi:hypothetical protein
MFATSATVSFVMSILTSVRLYVPVEQLSSHWMDFHEISYLRIALKSVENTQFSLKSDKNDEYFS